MWASVVDREGIVRAVCYSGKEAGDQWRGSRLIAVSKANTANAFSLPGFAYQPPTSISAPSLATFSTASSIPTHPIPTRSMLEMRNNMERRKTR
jgi:hypothetical protein